MKKALICFVLLMAATPLCAATRYTVFWLDEQYTPHVNLKGLQPLSEGMRAILALYALRISTGCPPRDDGRLYCNLTTSLGLGEQASKEQINLVRKWFRKRLPLIFLDKDETDRIVKSGDFWSLRYTVPDGASHQTAYDIIRVQPEGNKVTVYVMASWANLPEKNFGSFRNKTVYLIGGDSIEILSEKELK